MISPFKEMFNTIIMLHTFAEYYKIGFSYISCIYALLYLAVMTIKHNCFILKYNGFKRQ